MEQGTWTEDVERAMVLTFDEAIRRSREYNYDSNFMGYCSVFDALKEADPDTYYVGRRISGGGSLWLACDDGRTDAERAQDRIVAYGATYAVVLTATGVTELASDAGNDAARLAARHTPAQAAGFAVTAVLERARELGHALEGVDDRRVRSAAIGAASASLMFAVR